MWVKLEWTSKQDQRQLTTISSLPVWYQTAERCQKEPDVSV